MSVASNKTSNIIVNNENLKDFSFPENSTMDVKYINGKKEGTANVYSSKMTRIAILNYSNDVVDGLCIFFDEDGIKIKEAIYDKGVHNGWGCEYEDSNVVFVGFYKDGKRYSELRLNGQNGYIEEVRDRKTISYCKYTKDHKRDGLCYIYSNGKLNSGIMYENGNQVHKVYEIQDNSLYEYDENNKLIYQGDYHIASGKPPTIKQVGDGYKFEYHNDKVTRINHIWRNKLQSYFLLSEELLKEYKESNKLIYEGGFVIVDNIPKRHHKGFVYSSPTQYYSAYFENGKETRREKLFEDDVLVEYDNANQIVYKGAFDANKQRSGKGFVFSYVNNQLVDVHGYENGVTTYHRYHFADNVMEEYEENGSLVYKGGFTGDALKGFSYDGKGELYNGEGELMYSGDWVNNRQEGTGRFYNKRTLIYLGSVVNGVPDGNGSRLNESGDVLFRGQWHKGYIAQGNKYIHYESLKKCGLYEDYSLRYEGDWQNNLPHGEGVVYDRKGNVLYQGSWKEGEYRISDNLKYVYEKNHWVYELGKLKYVGGWSDGQPSGEGTLYKNSKMITEGHWSNGKCKLTNTLYCDMKEGVYVDYYSGGSVRYKGGWKHDLPHGKGVMYDENGKVLYEGKWKEGLFFVNSWKWYTYKNNVVGNWLRILFKRGFFYDVLLLIASIFMFMNSDSEDHLALPLLIIACIFFSVHLLHYVILCCKNDIKRRLYDEEDVRILDLVDEQYYNLLLIYLIGPLFVPFTLGFSSFFQKIILLLV